MTEQLTPAEAVKVVQEVAERMRAKRRLNRIKQWEAEDALDPHVNARGERALRPLLWRLQALRDGGRLSPVAREELTAICRELETILDD